MQIIKKCYEYIALDDRYEELVCLLVSTMRYVFQTAVCVYEYIIFLPTSQLTWIERHNLKFCRSNLRAKHEFHRLKL